MIDDDRTIHERMADVLAELPAIGKKIAIADGDDCWLWTGGIEGGGYGSSHFGGGTRRAHRVIYELFYGPIPAGLVVDHLCRTRQCVRPDHLEAVTQQENARRGDTGLHNRIKTACPQGHPYDVTFPGFRACRTCRNEASRRYRERKGTERAA